MRATSAFSLAAWVAARAVLADTHFLYMGYFEEAYVSGIEFDDEANTLTLASTYNVTSGSSRWIASDDDHRTLYIAGDGIYQSYSINSSDHSLALVGATVSDTTSCTLGVSLAIPRASSGSAGTIFGVAYDSGCSGVAINVDASTGGLVEQIANLTYDASAGVHGLALAPDGEHVYSADDMGSRVWAHAYDGATNVNFSSVTTIQDLDGAGARHLAVHPNGNWVYVIYESANEIGVYSRNGTTGELTNTNTTYSLLPDALPGNTTSSSYWSSDVATSAPNSTTPKYLLAYARGRTSDVNGYVNGFALDPETGAIQGRIFVEEASGYGGTTNAVTPSLFSEEYFTVTDNGENNVEVWQVAENATSASPVARLDLEAGPVNVVWYD